MSPLQISVNIVISQKNLFILNRYCTH
uniref:Uncharacterized protein n=1 Tax=Anguilla anguilla TaxID=7936 RepID=A0A0E9U7U4_ANGAN